MATNETDISTAEDEGQESETKPRLNLQVHVDKRSACERHLTITVPREDIDRYVGKTVDELVPKAQVPGFREGRAPRKLVESKFRKEVIDQVKGELLLDAIAQATDDEKLSAISEPDFDPVAVEVPEQGPMRFEFDIEVRPEFDLPEWKGLKIDRPVRTFGAKDVDRELQNLLARHGRLIPHDGPAEAGDYIVCHLRFKHGDQVVSEAREEVIRIRPILSFRDGKIEKFDALMIGVTGGETRTTTARLTDDAPNESLRGKEITAEFEVQEVKKLELPALTSEFLDELGGFASEASLRDAIVKNLERQLNYHQHQSVRRQVAAALTKAATWELPEKMLLRQSRRELERSVMELQRSGFNDEQIRAHANELRQNAQTSTARSLKEHFILERIAEEEKIDADAADYDTEISLIAAQTGESPRRVRAQIEKRNVMDILRNQIIERKTIDLILQHATFKEVDFTPEATATEAIDQAAGGEEEEIPEAKYSGEEKTIPGLEKKD